MPIYAYKCDACGHALDVLQKISDPVLTDCPACGAAALRKQVTAAGFQLKGSGWYVTDFRGGNGPAAKDGKDEAATAAAKQAAPAGDATKAASATTSPPVAGGGEQSPAANTSAGGSEKAASAAPSPAAPPPAASGR